MGDRVRPEDAQALDALRPALCAFLRRRSVYESDVDDLAADIIVKVMLAWPKFDPARGPDALRRWTFVFARNMVGDHMRQRRVMVPLRPEHAVDLGPRRRSKRGTCCTSWSVGCHRRGGVCS